MFSVKVRRCDVADDIPSEGFSLNGADFDAVLTCFRANSPQDLVGRRFASPKELGEDLAGIGLLRLTFRPPGKSRIPKQAIYERAAVALAKLQLPDYSDLDPMVVLGAFHEAFDCGKTLTTPKRTGASRRKTTLGWGVNHQWFAWFCGRVARLSHGQVNVRRIVCRSDEIGISCTGHGPQCAYEELVAVNRSGQKVRFDLGFRNTDAFTPASQGECPIVEYWPK